MFGHNTHTTGDWAAEVVYRECGQKTQAALATYFCGGERLHRTTPEAHLDDVLLDMWRSRLDATCCVCTWVRV